MNPVQSSTGMISIPQGNFGEGISTIPSKALIPALAELLERHSLFSCHTETIIWGSYNTLRPKNPVHPELFQYFSKKQIESFSSYKLITSDTKMGWVYSKSLIFGTQCLIPAQLVYILYYEQHPTEPYFFGTTTNGSAASSSYDEALYRALCEAFERDGLLNFWLNKIAPPVIDLDSIPYPHIKEQILKIKNSLLELYILDITTDMEVPVFAAVIVDRHGEIAVSVNTVAGFDIIRTLEKLLDEAVQAIQYSVVAEDVSEMGSSIQTFEQRRYFWSTQDKIPYISFFLQGRKKDFHEIRTIDEMSDIKTKNNKIKVILKNKNYECFVTDVTSHEARIAGLHVIKVIIPQLVPVYFHEKEKPLGVQRLFSFPVMHGYSTILSKEEYINNIPHPFI
jgi:ribosomal protein S12 methylthiotransferase accessory factor